MKLYRTQKFASPEGRFCPDRTRFTTSLGKAKTILKGDHIRVHECRIPDRLTAADWIDILEADSPGLQEINRAPIEFIEVVCEAYSKGMTDERT